MQSVAISNKLAILVPDTGMLLVPVNEKNRRIVPGIMGGKIMLPGIFSRCIEKFAMGEPGI